MSYDDYDDSYRDECAELAAEDRAERNYQNALLRHPDCRDPDHPGCEACCEED